ncbi:MAG: hypothetical protein ACYCZF_03475 [Anaerolineae bacterium]
MPGAKQNHRGLVRALSMQHPNLGSVRGDDAAPLAVVIPATAGIYPFIPALFAFIGAISG